MPPPLCCKKLVQMDLKLKPEFEKTRVRRRPYPAPQEQVEEIERQIQECIDAGLVEEYKKGDYPHHCSPCFLVAKPGSTALRLVVDYGEVNKKTQNHSGSIPNMENTLERIAKCRYKTKMDKRSGFWQVDLTAAAQELLAFITPKGRVFKWKIMPFGVANAPALLQELMNKILYILRRRPLVQEWISRGAEMEAHIDNVSLGTNTQEDHVLLLRECFIVCQENHLRIKLEKCEFMKEEMEYLGFDVGYGWWKPAASKMQPLQDMQIRDDPKKGLHDVSSFVGACNFYRRHIRNFTYSSAPLTDLMKKTTPWRWTAREEECFQEFKKKIASSNCLGVPCPKGEIVLITDASDVGGGGTIYQLQELNPAELTHRHYCTSGLKRDGSLKHDYPTSEWRLVLLGHWNWKRNQARSNYSTYDQELLAGMLVLSSQSRLLGSNPIEAVPRTPWPGYGIQQVSGPLTPCTEGKTSVDAPFRAVKPRIGNRCTASGDLCIRISGINIVLFSYCFRQFLRFRSDTHCFDCWRLDRDFTVTASLTVINGNFNAIRHEGSKVARNCMDASAIFIINTRNLNPNFSGCRNRIFDFDIPALDLTSFEWTYVLPYARINLPFLLPSICLKDMGKTKLIREATCEGHISRCLRRTTIRKRGMYSQYSRRILGSIICLAFPHVRASVMDHGQEGRVCVITLWP